MTQAICKKCGQIFDGVRSNHIFCSPICANLFHQNKYKQQHTLAFLREIECKNCGKKFTTTKAVHFFCSHQCHVNYYNQLKNQKERLERSKKVLCKYCGEEFISSMRRSVFCSVLCANRHKTKLQNEQRKVNGRYKQPCPICGSPKSPQAKYCRSCSNEFRFVWNPNKFQPLFQKICQVCDRDFVTVSENQLYCSDLCRRQVRAARQRQKKYNNRKLRGIRKGKLVPWSNIPEQGCTVCGENRVFDFAHLNKNDVIILCPNHHRMFDKGIIDIEYLKEHRRGDIPAPPIAPLLGVMDKTQRVQNRGIVYVTPTASELADRQDQRSQDRLQGCEGL